MTTMLLSNPDNKNNNHQDDSRVMRDTDPTNYNDCNDAITTCHADLDHEGADVDPQPTIFKVTGVDPTTQNWKDSRLEDCIQLVLRKSHHHRAAITTNTNDTKETSSRCEVTLLEKEFNNQESGTILFYVTYPPDPNPMQNHKQNQNNPTNSDDEQVLRTIREYISSLVPASSSSPVPTSAAVDWLRITATTATPSAQAAPSIEIMTIEEDDEDSCGDVVEYITEEEAYTLWLEGNTNNQAGEQNNSYNNTNNTTYVSSPDGILMQPTHDDNTHNHTTNTTSKDASTMSITVSSSSSSSLASNKLLDTTTTTTTQQQLQRDPGLYEYDNVQRIHYKELTTLLLQMKEQQQQDEANLLVSSSSSLLPSSVLSSSSLLSSILVQKFGSDQPVVIHDTDGDDNDDNEYDANANATEMKGSTGFLPDTIPATATATTITHSLHNFCQNLRNVISQSSSSASSLSSVTEENEKYDHHRGNGIIVRTGNRETLIENGFYNSKPAILSDVFQNSTTVHNENNNNKNTIIFNPIHELPAEFHTEQVLGRWLNNSNITNDDDDTPMIRKQQPPFPNSFWELLLPPSHHNNRKNDDDNVVADNDNENTVAEIAAGAATTATTATTATVVVADDTDIIKYTLCIANEGFGIGMHNHGPAMFLLTEGIKKWYLAPPDKIDALLVSLNDDAQDQQQQQQQQQQQDDVVQSKLQPKSKTHPMFYQELSTHKCLQTPGELLYVPNLWYHEIYNLQSPTIGLQGLAPAM